MQKALLASTSVILVLVSVSPAYAMNYTSSMFAGAQRYADSNLYKNSNYNFSIQPPLNWGILKLPSDISSDSVAVFSNGDKSQLATFGIYHKLNAPNVIDVLNSHPDNDILATVVQEMSTNSSDSRTIVYNGTVDRYSDGVKVSVQSVTHYTADNSASLSENIIYFLNNGNQYTLDMASNPNNIKKNTQLFEDSASTFFVTQANTVPEFPIVPIALSVSMILIIVSTRFSVLTRLGKHSTH
jgi:hypothetical protein